MIEPSIPEDEAARLAALQRYGILDTLPEVHFDQIVELAAFIAGTPIALVSLVDADRQWFKARYGLEAPETPRSVSFCGHVVAAGAPLVVEDAREDHRFHDNPIVVGGPRVVFYAGTPIRTPDGYVLGTLCAIDHSPRTLAPERAAMLEKLAGQVVQLLEQRRVARALERYRRLFDTPQMLPLILDYEGRVAVASTGWSQELGQAKGALVGTPLADLLDPRDRDALEAALGAATSGGAPVHVEVRTRIPAGPSRWFELRGDVDPQERLIYLLAYDATAYKQVDQLRTELMGMVSHELRTPLTSIHGSLRMLDGGLGGDLGADGRKLVQIASAGCERLIRMVTQLLDIQALEEHSVALVLAPVGAEDLMRTAQEETAAVAEGAGVHVAVQPCTHVVRGDRDRLVQVLINLVANAVKHSSRGAEVVVRAQAGTLGTRFEVVDSGPGIAASDQARLFKRFSQVGDLNTRMDGAGLGLALSKGLVEAHGGAIGVTSALGRGSCFWFTVPD